MQMSLAYSKLPECSISLLIHPKDFAVYRLYAMRRAGCRHSKSKICAKESKKKSACLCPNKMEGTSWRQRQQNRAPKDEEYRQQAWDSWDAGRAKGSSCVKSRARVASLCRGRSVLIRLEHVGCTSDEGGDDSGRASNCREFPCPVKGFILCF